MARPHMRRPLSSPQTSPHLVLSTWRSLSLKHWARAHPYGRRDSVVRPSLERPSPAPMLQLDPMLIRSTVSSLSSGLTAFNRCRVDVHVGSCDYRITSHPGPGYGLPLCCMHRRSRGRMGLIYRAADWRGQICEGRAQPHIPPAQRYPKERRNRLTLLA